MSLTTHFASRTHFGWDDSPSDFDFGPAVPSFDHLFDQMHNFDCFLCRESRGGNFGGRFNNNGHHARHHSSHNNRQSQFQNSFQSQQNQQLALNDSPRNHKLTVDVTGFRPDSVKAHVQNNKLIVTAKEEERTGGDYSLRELRKTIDLPANADGQRLTSQVRGGTLHIEVPLRSEQRQSNDCYQRNDYGRNRSVERKNSFERRDHDNLQLRQRHHSSDRNQVYNESRVDVVHKFENGPSGSVDDLTVTFTNNPGNSHGSTGFGNHQGSTSFGNHGSTSAHGSTGYHGSTSAGHGSAGFGSTGFGNHQGSTSFANHGSTSAKYDSHSSYHGSSTYAANHYGSTSAAHGSSGYANHGSTGFGNHGSTSLANHGSTGAHYGSTSAVHGSTGYANHGSTSAAHGSTGFGSTGFVGRNDNEDDYCLAIDITLPERVDPSKVCVTVKDEDVIVKIEDQKQGRDGTSSFSFFQKHTIPRGADVNGIRCVLNGNKLTVKAPFAGRGGQHNGRRVQNGQPLPIENGYGGSSRNF